MKKKLLFLFSIVFVCAICLFGCGVSALQGGPNRDDVVYGNGGYSVMKGDYLYFSNAYYDYSELNDGDNKYDFNSSKKTYGIFRVKLNRNHLVDLDEDGFPIGAELMVPQVGAHAYSGLYICGNYLYYTTPFTGNKSGKYVEGLVTFDRVNLDRTGHKVLLRMEDYNETCKYFVNYINGVTYITILDVNSNLILLTVQGENVQNKTIATGVASVATPEQNNVYFEEETTDFNKYVYYTKKDDNNYYSLYKKSLVSPSDGEKVLINSSEKEIDIITIKNSRVYFKEDGVLKSSTFENNSTTKIYTDQKIAGESENGIKSYYILNDTEGTPKDMGIACVVYNGSNYYLNIYGSSYYNNQTKYLFEDSNQINVLYAQNNFIYYNYYKIEDDDALYYCDLSNLSKTKEKVCEEFLTTVGNNNTVYDFDSYHGFYFNNVEGSNNSNFYLHMVNLFGQKYEDEKGNSIGHYIGVLDASNMK